MSSSGGKGGGGSLGTLSPFDISAISNAYGLNTEAIHNRYSQLGLGVPSGDPKAAAAGGTNLSYGGPSTMEQQDIAGAGLQANAALGQLETTNISNPALNQGLAGKINSVSGIGGLLGNLGSGIGNLFGGL
jgi:hypothetical protein